MSRDENDGSPSAGERLVWRDWQVRLPEGWEAIAEQAMLALLPAVRPGARVEEPVDAVSISMLSGRPEQLAVLAATAMARRVAQGEPEFRETQFAGTAALHYRWNDGLARVDSWFVVRGDVIYEIQRVEPWIRSVGDERMAVAAQTLCERGLSFSTETDAMGGFSDAD